MRYIQYSCCILVNEADELYWYTPRYPEHAARKTEIRKISLHRVVWLQRIFIVSSVETSVVEFKNNTKSIGPLDSVMIKKNYCIKWIHCSLLLITFRWLWILVTQKYSVKGWLKNLNWFFYLTIEIFYPFFFQKFHHQTKPKLIFMRKSEVDFLFRTFLVYMKEIFHYPVTTEGIESLVQLTL